ncbi:MULTISPECIES: hypothetical protein [unclassified Mesorhizobium]|uniref:hypothetical protein n=1 Tax=unclassified Mesorhizobium TaxID=325217 RepID=UPI0003CE585A|nr:hypothetical protein [Mesorhizobium sp. LSHC414A00]ESX78247.1 hypothetical protein X757_08990 [Mesorhizobium sp. LSHC414A00]
MTDIAITAANVVAGANAVIENGYAAAAITAGQVVYRDASGKYNLADTDSATALVRKPRGIALNGASIGQPVAIQRSGDITIGAAVTKGVAYYLSGTPGGICPVADVAAGDYPAVIGIATSASVLSINIVAPDAIL